MAANSCNTGDILNLDGVVPRLDDYGISPTVAFVNETPKRTLSEYFDPWWRIGTRLTELVESGTLRDEVHKMPQLDYRQLDESEWRLAHIVLSAITQCYVWMFGEDRIPRSIPENLAIPFYKVSELLGITPSYCQFQSVHDNWMLINTDGPMIADNMTPIINLLGGQDQVWFFMVSAQIEIDFAPALNGLLQAQQAVKDLDVDAYIAALQKVEEGVRTMKGTLGRMRGTDDECRNFISLRGKHDEKFKKGRRGAARDAFIWDSPAFKKKGWEGLIYEGISPEPLCYGGGSAAQSAPFHCLDAAIGVRHQPNDGNVLEYFQSQMLPSTRRFIKALALGPSIRNFASYSKNSKALHVYNACLQSVLDFRTFHIAMVTQYIVIQSHRNDTNKLFLNQGGTGTGGTAGFMQFLKGVKKTVQSTFYQQDEGTEIN